LTSGSLAQSTPSLATSGRERTDLDEGGSVADRVHPAESQAGDRIPPGGRPSLVAEDQDEDQHHSRQRPGLVH